MTKHDPFIMLPHTVYDSPAFAALDPIHITVLLLLMRKHNGHNNGSIALGVREVEKRCHCSRATAGRALKRLQTDGLITVTYKGHLVPEIGRPDVATRWRLNFLKEKTLPRLTREPSGRFSSETSLTKPVRFSSETSPRVSPQNQYIDYLTTAKAKQDGTSECMSEPPTSPSEPLAGDGRECPPDKPNDRDRMRRATEAHNGRARCPATIGRT
jgi:hypothetical protein